MRYQLLGACAVAALALAACGQQNAGQSASSEQPLAPPSPAETAPAPAASSLPPAPPAPVRYAPPARRYTALNDAYAMSQSYADAPPDYAFDYDGDAPEAWGSRDGVVRVGERVPGGWRYYYYQPGSDTPYLVRDPEYAYGFDGGQLAVIYDSRGRALPPDYANRQAWLAGRYLTRARDLWHAAREHHRMDVEAQVWREQHADQERQRRSWEETRNADPDWRAYHDEHQGEAQDRWAQVAAAWAAAQFANAPPPQRWEHRPEGGVDEARQAWRARMAQQQGGNGQPPAHWNGQPPQGEANGQPPQGRWNGPPPQGEANGQPPQGRWNGPPPQGEANGQPPQGRWNGPPPQGEANGQPPQGRWNGPPPQGEANGQPPQGRWNGQPHGPWNGRPGEPQPQGRPGGQGWGGGPSDRQAQQQADAEHQRQLQAQQQAQAEHQQQLQAQRQAQAEHQQQLQAQRQAQADHQRQLQAQQQAQAEHQQQLQAQRQAQADHQRQLQAQQQAQAEHQHQLQAQQQAQAEHQRQLQAQQQAQAAHGAKPQAHPPAPGKPPLWHGHPEPSSQPPHQQP